jgi:transposase-like protein
MSEWTDEKRAQVVEMYKERGPTPENSMEIVKEIAEEIGASPNGVRMILSKEGVYVKKDPSSGSTNGKKTNGGTGTTRVSKEEAHARLVRAIEAPGGNADTDIVSKLTGKAALYFAEILENRNN